LPDTSGLIQFAVNVLGIHLVGQADTPRKRCFCLRYCKQMDMVVHQAIGPYLKVVFYCISSQQFKICLAIFVIEKNSSAIIATLCDVMRIPGDYDACDSWHGVNDTIIN